MKRIVPHDDGQIDEIENVYDGKHDDEDDEVRVILRFDRQW